MFAIPRNRLSVLAVCLVELVLLGAVFHTVGYNIYYPHYRQVLREAQERVSLDREDTTAVACYFASCDTANYTVFEGDGLDLFFDRFQTVKVTSPVVLETNIPIPALMDTHLCWLSFLMKDGTSKTLFFTGMVDRAEEGLPDTFYVVYEGARGEMVEPLHFTTYEEYAAYRYEAEVRKVYAQAEADRFVSTVRDPAYRVSWENYGNLPWTPFTAPELEPHIEA